MLKLARKLLKNLLSLNKETCAECGKVITKATALPRNNDENICAHCYGREMMKADAYEIYYTDR